MAIRFPIATYNVLSSHLAEPDYFTHCEPADLDASARLRRVLSKFDVHTEHRAVICVQEVSRDWSGKLHAYFQQRGYTFVTSLYAGACTGYMGVGVAFPNATWRLLDADIRRVSETKSWPPEDEKPRVHRPGDWTCPACKAHVFASRSECYKCQARKPRRGFRELLTSCFCGISGASGLGVSERPTQLLYLNKARGRENALVAVHLQSLDTPSQSVWIGCYHMPCAFRDPQVMVMHVALAMQHMQRLALATTAPCVVAGDWNFKPCDEAYQLATTGDLARDSSAYPAVPANDDWVPNLQFPMRSAYATRRGAEPDFTNFAQVQDEDPFIDTLDYIFCSPQLNVIDAEELPQRAEVPGPLPTATEPSDHILVSATLELPADAATLTAALHQGKVSTKVRTKRESNDQLRQELAAQLRSFVASDDTVLCMPPSLNAFQRKVVHELASQLGLKHESTGEGTQRYIRVEK
eukprot:TRINITY_DN27852_c0_g1_i1.p1 TRINITY_DN27852_c0_g1~~TRINITY_DN27852_c0_g1_i1.p1  ORF type:complete len:481 (-),score=71.11 TRINITY_DN27852_c0_g1_i1:50-1447(-)